MSEDATATLSGSLIDGRYRVEREVGAGGFGTVYCAVHVGLGARVALKVLDVPEHMSPERRARLVGGFLEEARTLKRLRHPNIVAALDVGLLPAGQDGLQLPYLVMEWCSGPTLRQHLEALPDHKMSLDAAWALFEPMLAAMAHAHAAGVAHRDLKPGNVLLVPADHDDAQLQPRVIDFGIAKIVAPDDSPGSGSTNTSSGGSPFTPRYAAPEQLAGARTGPWTDVHALALLFVEMVTGQAAIGTDADAMLAVFDPVRPTPKTFGVDVGALESVLDRALALRPADRYPDAAALAAAMRALARSGWPQAAPANVESSPRVVTGPPPQRSGETLHVQPGDPTAPPSSHTLRTRDYTTAPGARTSGGKKRHLLAAAVAVPLVLASGAAGLRQAGRWPFTQRLRDLPEAEVGRRMSNAGLGACTSSQSQVSFVQVCLRGFAMLMRVGVPYTTPESIRAHVAEVAMANAHGEHAARYAVDGDIALIVAAPRTELQATFAAVLGEAAADVIADARPREVASRSAASLEKLAAWTGEDLVASVAATGFPISYSNASAEPAAVHIDRDPGLATAILFTRDARNQLDILRGRPEPFAWALDEDKLLVIKGDPTVATLDFVGRLLADARAAEMGTHP